MLIVFHTLPGGEVVVNQAGAHAGDLVGADGRADAAPADRDAAFDGACGHRFSQRYDEIGIVVVRRDA